MSRFANNTQQLMNSGYAGQLGSPNQRIVSLHNRFQNGYLTDLTFMPSATDYVRQPMIVKVLRAPTGFGMLPDGNLYTQALVNLVETLMQSWSGFNRTLNVSVAETQIGRSNEVFQTPTRTSRTRTNLTSTVVEKDGMPVTRFLDHWVRYLIQDPDTGHPLITGVAAQATDRLADMYSMDLIAYEPDKTFQFVNDAYLLTNVFPINDIGERTGDRQLQQDGELRTHNLSWACTQKVGYAVDQLAQRFMDSAKVTGIDPSMQPNFIGGMKESVAGVETSALAQINELKAQMVRP